MSSFQERADRVAAVAIAERHVEKLRRSVATLGALGLGIGLGASVAETRSLWVIGGALVYTLAIMVETIVMHRQLKQSVTRLENLTSQARETA